MIKRALIVKWTELPEKWKDVAADYWNFRNDVSLPLEAVFNFEQMATEDKTIFDVFMEEVFPDIKMDDFDVAYLDVCW